MTGDLDPELISELGRPDAHIFIDGVIAETYVLILPSPGGARMLCSSDTDPSHTAYLLRGIVEIIEATNPPPCGCGEHG